MSEHIKEGNKIQLHLNWPGKPEGNAKEVAAFVGAKSFGLDGDLNYMYIYEPTQTYRVTNLETYASTLHENIIQDGQWVELWKEETETAEQLEQERLDKGLGVEAPRITLEHIQALMQRVEVVTEYSDNPIPHVTAKAFLDGSFFLGTAVSKAVDPANFDKELGFKYSTQNVLKAAEDKLWELEGYALYKNLQAAAVVFPPHIPPDMGFFLSVISTKGKFLWLKLGVCKSVQSDLVQAVGFYLWA